MKTIKLLLTLIVLISINLKCLGQEGEASQKLIYKTGNPADWPLELDAVIAAPDNHKILLENDHVRVLEVSLLPGEIEPLHHHSWPSALYIQEAGDFTDSDGEGNIIFDSRKISEPLPMPFTMYKEPEAPHTVTNLSKTVTIRLIRVEMKTEETKDNTQIIDNMYKAFATGDMPTVLGSMHPNIEWNEAEGNSLADGNPYIGSDAILNGVFARLGANHEYFHLKDIQLHNMSDNKVLATLRYDAKVKTTGKVYNVQAAHLWTLNADGKVIAFQQYVDTKTLADAETN